MTTYKDPYIEMPEFFRVEILTPFGHYFVIPQGDVEGMGKVAGARSVPEFVSMLSAGQFPSVFCYAYSTKTPAFLGSECLKNSAVYLVATDEAGEPLR